MLQHPAFSLADSMPLTMCLFARASNNRSNLLRGEGVLGKHTLLKRPFRGFGVNFAGFRHGVVARFSVPPADAHELPVLPGLVSGSPAGSPSGTAATGR